MAKGDNYRRDQSEKDIIFLRGFALIYQGEQREAILSVTKALEEFNQVALDEGN